MRRVHIAITGFAGLNNPEPGLGVAKALREGWFEKSSSSLEITALVYDGKDTAAWSPGVADRLFLVPPVANGNASLLHRLAELDKLSSIDIVIPVLDLEIPLYSQLKSDLNKLNIRMLVPSLSSLSLVNKVNLPYFCYRNTIPTPQTIHTDKLETIGFYANQLGYPVYVKGTVVGAKLVNNEQQAYSESLKLNGRWGGGVLLQKPIRGDEYVVAMVADADGEAVGMVSMRKIGVNRLGKGVIGAVVNDPTLESFAERVLSLIKWKGPLELELIRGSNGKWVLVEINNRFPSWILLSYFAGMNLPLLLVKEILKPGMGHDVNKKAKPSSTYVRSVEDNCVNFTEWRELRRHGVLSIKSRKEKKSYLSHNIQNLPVVAVTGISAFDDVMPGIGVASLLSDSVSLHGLAYGAYDTGAFHPGLFDKIHMLPEAMNEENLLEYIIKINSEYGINVIIPTLDIEIPLFQKIMNKLLKYGVMVMIASKESFIQRGKKQLMSVVSQASFDIPKTIISTEKKELKKIAKNLGFPLAIKGMDTGCWRLSHMGMIDLVWPSIPTIIRKEFLVQEWVDGDVFSVSGVCDMKYNAHSLISIHKLVRGENGETWGAVSVNLPDLEMGISEFLNNIEWIGPFEAEFVRESESGRYYLIEINPRFPAWIGFAKGLGVNPAMTLLEILDGQKPDLSRAKVGECYLRNAVEYRATISQLTNKT